MIVIVTALLLAELIPSVAVNTTVKVPELLPTKVTAPLEEMVTNEAPVPETLYVIVSLSRSLKNVLRLKGKIV